MFVVRKFNPELHHRQSTRVRGYDYSQPGCYFVTICTHQRERLFGSIHEGEMMLNQWGSIARDEWLKTPGIRPEIQLGNFVVMPDHFHAILIIQRKVWSKVNAIAIAINQKPEIANKSPRSNEIPHLRSPSMTVGAVVRGFKSAVTTRINMLRETPGQKVWQRNYHDRIIWDKRTYYRISKYIQDNPKNWKE